jgi:WD40 repeat protein
VSSLSGHRDLVRALAWSPDGAALASGSDDMTVRLWDPVTGDLDLTLGGPAMSDAERLNQKMQREHRKWHLYHGAPPGQKGHTDYITALAWSPDGTTLASGSYDKTVRVWALNQGAVERKVLRFEEFVFALAWSMNPGLLTVAEENGRISVWKAGEHIVALDFNCGYKEISSIAWSPSGALMAIAAFDRPEVQVFSAGGKALGLLQGHASGVRAVAWSPDGSRLASAGPDGIQVGELHPRAA